MPPADLALSEGREGLFVALYRMTVKPGEEAVFEEAWRAVTEAIYAVRGSLGSRLHRVHDASMSVYVAYAQWPSAEIFESGVPLPEHMQDARKRMRDACISIETVHTMTICDDRLR